MKLNGSLVLKFLLAGILLAVIFNWPNRNKSIVPDFVSDQEVPAAPEKGGGGEEIEDLHPLTIKAMQAKEYPGSEIKIEQDLGDKGKFRSYIISYQSDGLALRALMNVPDGAKPQGGFPVLILNHGFIPPDTYSTTSSYKAFADFYSNNGYLLIKPDYRGHDDSPGEPTSAHISPDYTTDVMNLIASIKKHPDANPDKIGIWGHSMGGGITLRAMILSKDIKAAMLVAGVVASPAKFYEYWEANQTSPRASAWIKSTGPTLREMFGTPSENPGVWDKLSSYKYFDQITAPASIHHGTADDSVPLVFSEELNQALLGAGKSVEYFVYPGADHNLAGNARGLFLSRSLAFFDKHLK